MRRIIIITEEWRPLEPLLQAYDQKGVAIRLIAAPIPTRDVPQFYGSEPVPEPQDSPSALGYPS